ncbi:Replication factor C, subunit RFC4 [Maudiozyma exigua]|uniref:Replication factor C, subunit RFC4 n=1 Tax=Maudiozyma exigua TaxID=34358 RepID=A0A9P6WE15_MAUEX|nr:Replication factor C, subunit RFC4 [Kazachstania exigua]
MKILTSEEINAHSAYTLKGGALGAVIGLAGSAALFKLLPRRFPGFKPSQMTWSVKTALFITPPTLFTAICAEEASNRFDALKYSGSYMSDEALERQAAWEKLSKKEQMVETLNNNKYKIITGLWAASLYASWEIINRDKIMNATQKAVQARMYAQFITVILLLCSVGLSTYEKKLNPDKAKHLESQRWANALKAAAEQEKMADAQTTFSNEERRDAKIFKYD